VTPLRTIERAALAALLAATLASVLLVARNGLAPTQRPLTFGLVLWAWATVFYAAIALVPLLLCSLASRLPRLRGSSRWLVAMGAALFAAVTTASNPRAVSSLFSLEGPARFRMLAPAAAVLATLGLMALAALSSRRAAVVRVLALLAVASTLLALVPWPGRRGISRGVSASVRVQGQRFVLVGVDGADWRLMEPLMARGDLPHFSALKAQGAWGPLETLRPTLSPAIWTSAVTGKRPRRHGVRGFTTRRLRGVEETFPGVHPLNRLGFPILFARLEAAGQLFQSPITSATRRVPAFWTIATAQGSPVDVVNWWATWPAEPVLGHVVSERAYYHELLHRGRRVPADRLTHPEGLYAQIAPRIVLPEDVTLQDTRAFMDVTAEEFARMQVKHPSPLTGIAAEFTYFLSTFATNERLSLELLERSRRLYGDPADLLVLFRLVDKTCHTALVYSELVDDHLDAPADDVRRYRRVVSEAYRAADRAVGRIREAFGNGNVIVVSDHGFELEPSGRYGHGQAPAGVFLAAGPAFRSGPVDGLSVLDVLPLLLYMKGFPLADDFDGRLAGEALAPELLAARPPRRIASYRAGGEGGGSPGASDVDAEMLERLRALGYLR
jgi:hypothetical protein